MKTNIGFAGVLGLMFIAFKLLGIISWSWLWVTAPLWAIPVIQLGGTLLLLAAAVVVALVVLATLVSSSLVSRIRRFFNR